MRIFVTGGTGFVGSAVVRELIDGGHDVLGLARSIRGAQALKATGAGVHIGSLQDLEALRQGCAAADAVAHLAFDNDFSEIVQGCEDDRRAIEAMGDALGGSDRPILVTSGMLLTAKSSVADEDDEPSTYLPRASEAAAAALAGRGVRASVVRLAPSTHGDGDHGLVPQLAALARLRGVSAYVGDGANRWPAVHRLDAARLYRLALEHGAGNRRYHAVAEEGVPFKEIAAVIARQLGVPLVSLSSEDANTHFGWLALFAGSDLPTSAIGTRGTLAWVPNEASLLEDIDRADYFTD